ncbi:MAG: hypothetical protein NZ522_03900, partial [Chitinophagales bacterium]|nr:hypothetical protein [Chitinophagales bacterium]
MWLFLPLFLILFIFEANAQYEDFTADRNYSSAFLIAPSYSYQFALGDLAKRFGGNSNIGATLTYHFLNRWHIGVEGGFLFGNNVRENTILDSLATATDGNSAKFINALDNSLLSVQLQQRGWCAKLIGGKTIILNKKQDALNHSGLLVLTGLGFLEHKILIDVSEEVLPQLNKTYRKGYDRLTNGFMLSQFIGGILLKQGKWISFYAGVQADVAFTKNRRPWNFDLYAADKSNRIDMLIGL